MLVMDVGDEVCWWQFKNVGDGFGHFGHQHPLSLNINVRRQHPKDVTKILILSPTFLNCHQHDCRPIKWLPLLTLPFLFRFLTPVSVLSLVLFFVFYFCFIWNILFRKQFSKKTRNLPSTFVNFEIFFIHSRINNVVDNIFT